ncbi:MAG: two-component regulator propeller domain-containing protein [Vicinamibacterales bacterium]|nr:two-component regulator propeller domain-containing protein [Vicinamibacterales bacterium]
MFLLLMAAMLSASPPPPLPTVSVDQWEVDHGLPQNSVNAILQTRDGYLWLGTWAGLVRFDGVRFTPVAADLPNNHILALVEHPDGSVWIGTGGGGVARWQGHTFQLFTTADGLVHDNVRTLAVDAAGRIWVGTSAGVSVIHEGAATTPVPTGVSALGIVNVMTPSDKGDVWMSTSAGVICRTRGVSLTCWPAVTGMVDAIRALLPMDDGTVLVGLPGRVAQWTGASLEPWPACTADCLGTGQVRALLPAAAGGIWVGLAHGGIVRVDDSGRGVDPIWPGLSGEVTVLHQDGEGSLWTGTTENGLVRLRPTRVTTFGAGHGLRAQVITSIVQDGAGTVWTGGRCAPLTRRTADGTFEPFLAEYIGTGCVVAVLAARDGTLWFSLSQGGVYRWRDGAARYIGTHEGLSPSSVVSLFEDADGAIWLGTDAAGAHRLIDDRIETFGEAQGLPAGRLVTFAQDGDGRIWAGSNANGLFVLEGERFRHLGAADGLPTRLVSTLRFDSHGDLWIGTANQGLYRMRDGRFEHFGPEHGLPDPVVALTLEDANGDLWVSTSRGISRLTRDQIEAVVSGRARSLDPIVLGKADGLRSLEGSGGGFDPAGLRDRDDRLWFSTLDGIVVIDPATLPLNPVPPPVAIEHVIVDEAAVEHGVGGQVRVPAGTRGLEIAYTAFSLLAPDRVRFRYRLARFEDEWHEAGNRRSAFYTNLPPASYTFEVLAANNDGVWSPAPATLQITVAPLWWQRRAVQALALVVLLGLTGGGVRTASLRRARARVAELEREQALTRERTRIARDLHDDIGARLTHLALLADRGAEPGTRAELSASARETARTMDELVWSVNASHDTLEGLASYAMRFTERHARAAGLTCRFDTPAAIEAYPLAAEERRHVFLAIKEAVNNAVKHAGATGLRLGMTVNARVLEVAIADDGRGFEWETSAGNGITNMGERMTAVGGSMTIESIAGGGTTVRFRVPLHQNTAPHMPMR